jgi:hypothetical protein
VDRARLVPTRAGRECDGAKQQREPHPVLHRSPER